MRNCSALIILFFTAALAHSQNCESVVALSRVSTSTVSDKDTVEQQAANFCSEYSKSSGKSSSASFGASYKFLSANYGSSDASLEAIASKYCSASNNYSSSKDAYKQYIESISPGAYGAYEQCIKMSKSAVNFEIDETSILPREFSMTISFATTVADSIAAKINFSTSEGVNCKWSDGQTGTISLKTGSSNILKCSRKSEGVRSYVTIARIDGNEHATIPWQAYTPDGIPVNVANALKNQIEQLAANATNANARLQAIENAPAINVFHCPTGMLHPTGGAWGFYGCKGQITTDSTCVNIEYPTNESRNCDPIGKLRTY